MFHYLMYTLDNKVIASYYNMSYKLNITKLSFSKKH